MIEPTEMPQAELAAELLRLLSQETPADAIAAAAWALRIDALVAELDRRGAIDRCDGRIVAIWPGPRPAA